MNKIKNNFFLIILMFSLNSVTAQKTAPGYYIDKNNDTIKAEIKQNAGLFGSATNDYFITLIEVKDDSGNFKKLKPEDIKAYGFEKDGISYRMFSKPSRQGKQKFLAPVVTGPQTSLYKYGIMTYGGAINYNQTFYTFENADGKTLVMNNVMNKKLGAELKEFYKEYPEVHSLIDERFKYWLDLETDFISLLTMVNNSKNK